MTETATQEKLDALAPYSEVRAEIEKLKTENAGLSFDYESKSGNKAARSHIHGLRKLKGEIERRRKDAKADALEYGRKVDNAAKELTGEVESMIAVHEKPLKEIEEREEARKQKHRDRLVELQMPTEIIPDSKSCRIILDRVESVNADEGWDEFAGEARETQHQTVTILKQRLTILEKQEADAAELERLRKENAERIEREERARAEREEKERKEREAREAKEREERIAREAAENAKREAEEAAERKRAEEEAARKAEAEKAMAEARRKEQEAQAAIEAERREAEKKLEEEREKARQAKLEAERVKREAEERDRQRAEAERRKQEEEAKRAADEAHRENVLSEAADAISATIEGSGYFEGGNVRALAMAIAFGIANDKVPHTSIKF